MPVFKRSITASRSIKNFQILLITFGAMSKSAKRIFQTKHKMNCLFSPETPYTFGERNTQFSGEYFGKTLFTLLDISSKVINKIWIFLMLHEAVMLVLKTGITALHIQSSHFLKPPKQEFLLRKHFRNRN